MKEQRCVAREFKVQGSRYRNWHPDPAGMFGRKANRGGIILLEKELLLSGFLF